jgi:hypothetical protein
LLKLFFHFRSRQAEQRLALIVRQFPGEELLQILRADFRR